MREARGKKEARFEILASSTYPSSSVRMCSFLGEDGKVRISPEGTVLILRSPRAVNSPDVRSLRE